MDVVSTSIWMDQSLMETGTTTKSMEKVQVGTPMAIGSLVSG